MVRDEVAREAEAVHQGGVIARHAGGASSGAIVAAVEGAIVLSRAERHYRQGIDTEEIIATVHARRAPMMSATAGLQL